MKEFILNKGIAKALIHLQCVGRSGRINSYSIRTESPRELLWSQLCASNPMRMVRLEKRSGTPCTHSSLSLHWTRTIAPASVGWSMRRCTCCRIEYWIDRSQLWPRNLSRSIHNTKEWINSIMRSTFTVSAVPSLIGKFHVICCWIEDLSLN